MDEPIEDKLYDDMLRLLQDKNESDRILATLKIKLERTEFPIGNTELTDTQKNQLIKIITHGIKFRESRERLTFHNCLKCMYWIKKPTFTQENTNYAFNKPCKLFSRATIINLWNLKLKCKFFDLKKEVT